MKRLTTDAPSGNFETMLNFVHGKDGWAHIYDADGKEVNLITWALNHCHDRGCDDFQCKTLEEYDEALSSCMFDSMDCPIAMAYCFASQAVHLRSRLKMYEDTGLKPEEVTAIKHVLMGQEIAKITEFDGIPVKHLIELVQSKKDGRLVVLPAKTVFVLTWDAGKFCDLICPVAIDDKGCCDFCDKGELFVYEVPCKQEHIEQMGGTVFLTREEAEAALKKRIGGNDGTHDNKT